MQYVHGLASFAASLTNITKPLGCLLHLGSSQCYDILFAIICRCWDHAGVILLFGSLEAACALTLDVPLRNILCMSAQQPSTSSGWDSLFYPASAAGVMQLHRMLFSDLDARRLTRFLRALESGYSSQNEVLYHSRTHAADVVQSMHVLLTQGGLGDILASTYAGRQDVATQLVLLAAYLAAAMHDVHHMGLTNDFLIRT